MSETGTWFRMDLGELITAERGVGSAEELTDA